MDGVSRRDLSVVRSGREARRRSRRRSSAVVGASASASAGTGADDRTITSADSHGSGGDRGVKTNTASLVVVQASGAVLGGAASVL
jgi:hypothetical protein